jgi:hypothetical protein
MEACRGLQRIVEPFGFLVALYGGVLMNGTGNDLDRLSSTSTGGRQRARRCGGN